MAGLAVAGSAAGFGERMKNRNVLAEEVCGVPRVEAVWPVPLDLDFDARYRDHRTRPPGAEPLQGERALLSVELPWYALGQPAGPVDLTLVALIENTPLPDQVVEVTLPLDMPARPEARVLLRTIRPHEGVCGEESQITWEVLGVRQEVLAVAEPRPCGRVVRWTAPLVFPYEFDEPLRVRARVDDRAAMWISLPDGGGPLRSVPPSPDIQRVTGHYALTARRRP